MSQFWRRLGRAVWAAAFDGCLAASKGAAYSAMLSIFPVLSAFTAIFAQVKAETFSRTVARILFQVAPPGTEVLLEQSFRSRGERPVLLLITATVLSVFAASGVMLSLIDGFQAAYRTKNTRSFWKNRAVAMGLVLFVALPIIGVSALVVYTGSANYLLLAVVSVCLSNLILYRFGPDIPVSQKRTRCIWPGSLVAAGLWMIFTVGFLFYLRHLADYNVIYGSLGAVMALLVWLYLLSASILIGCEYNAERDRELGL